MVIKVCPKCKGSMKKMDDELVCTKCSFIEKNTGEDFSTKEKITKKELRGEGIIDDKNIFATYSHKCEKCGYNKAEIIDQGVKYSDEAGDLLLKCGKCGWSEHLNKKVS